MLVERTKHLKRDFTATGYVMNPSRTKMLLIFHNKLRKWMPAGGHLEPNEMPHDAALREVFEETGILAQLIHDGPQFGTLEADECQLPRPYTVLYEFIPTTPKASEHIHVDFVYAMQANETPPTQQLSEVSNAGWFTKQQIFALDSYEFVRKFAALHLG